MCITIGESRSELLNITTCILAIFINSLRVHFI